MPANRQSQVNVRSDRLKRRVDSVTARTRMSATRFLKEAADRFEPEVEELPPGLERHGWLLVAKPRPGLPPVTIEQINAAIEEDRNMRGTICPCSS